VCFVIFLGLRAPLEDSNLQKIAFNDEHAAIALYKLAQPTGLTPAT